MPRGETCLHGMPPRMCGHCRAPRGDRYELRPAGHRYGHPVVQILKNGGPIHSYDREFKFGASKVRLLLAALPAIEQFVAKGEELVLESDEILDEYGLIRCRVQHHDRFINSWGQEVQRSWLHLERGDTRIGIGYEKAKAVEVLRDELCAWLRAPVG